MADAAPSPTTGSWPSSPVATPCPMQHVTDANLVSKSAADASFPAKTTTAAAVEWTEGHGLKRQMQLRDSVQYSVHYDADLQAALVRLTVPCALVDDASNKIYVIVPPEHIAQLSCQKASKRHAQLGNDTLRWQFRLSDRPNVIVPATVPLSTSGARHGDTLDALRSLARQTIFTVYTGGNAWSMAHARLFCAAASDSRLASMSTNHQLNRYYSGRGGQVMTVEADSSEEAIPMSICSTSADERAPSPVLPPAKRRCTGKVAAAPTAALPSSLEDLIRQQLSLTEDLRGEVQALRAELNQQRLDLQQQDLRDEVKALRADMDHRQHVPSDEMTQLRTGLLEHEQRHKAATLHADAAREQLESRLERLETHQPEQREELSSLWAEVRRLGIEQNRQGAEQNRQGAELNRQGALVNEHASALSGLRAQLGAELEGRLEVAHEVSRQKAECAWLGEQVRGIKGL